ncbi:hypothetical protein MtrunA17_Chr3g0131481 [Medicago truncatula]|uniref:Transmembrane protein n=1 Tax=Medicago truncatula TaxID=3880 RepID=A0A396IWH6_MEDTR|nr:hypothetical protein MtrunA17_Chr3g0131481 [Medicago truncatula]
MYFCFVLKHEVLVRIAIYGDCLCYVYLSNFLIVFHVIWNHLCYCFFFHTWYM